jgi:hydrophobe/amphiphile efflux-3 (HAE3) family protein
VPPNIVRRLPEIVARFVERRPWWLIIVAVVFTAAAIPGIILLNTETGFNTLVSPHSEVYQDNIRYEEQFGGEPITVLLTGQLEDIFAPDNLAILNGFNQSFSQDQRYRSILGPLPSDDQHALMIVTPVGNMDDAAALEAVQDVEDFFSQNPLHNVDTTVIGDAKVINAISASIGNNMALLLGLSVGVMTLILFLMFRVRWRLLSLLMVGVGALWTFGIMGYASVPLSMATMAVLPILVGLGIDYSIQFHNRYQEEVARSSSVTEAITTSLTRMFPVAGIALLATIIGFVTLYISEVPMVRDFGLMLAVGVALCYVVGLFLLYSILHLSDRKAPIAKLGQAAVAASRRTERILSRISTFVIRNPLPILVIAAILGIAGGVVDHWLPTNTDYEQLMPQNIAALQEVRELRDILGRGGELRFMVEAEDVTTPDFLSWLNTSQNDELELYPELISVNSPATLISNATGGYIPSSQEQIDYILANTPSQYVEQVISGDRKMASVSFSIKHMPLEQVHDFLGQMMEDMQPPDGVRIAPVGSLALGASTVDAVVGPRLLMNILCMGAVFAVLLLIYRRLPRALFIILPVGLVIGLASLVMYVAGIALNPLTAVLGIIIVGINTEFMVLLTSRYEEEKQKGESPRRAMVIASSKMGRAIVTTGLTTLAGFGVLVASNFVMIRDFGIVTIIGVFLCLVSTIVVMPPLIVWFDERSAKKRLAKQSRHTASR